MPDDYAIGWGAAAADRASESSFLARTLHGEHEDHRPDSVDHVACALRRETDATRRETTSHAEDDEGRGGGELKN
ncbi:hypothetical protein V9T40_004658 [Parthenolecanium corni]|uniref:Uncharacterized protein n=1 Tax=Parthenolecanium corni TaxID=536013 RepID=A0AAN9Y3B0_9HEMI